MTAGPGPRPRRAADEVVARHPRSPEDSFGGLGRGLLGDLERGLLRSPSGTSDEVSRGELGGLGRGLLRELGDLGYLNITGGGDVPRYLHKNAKISVLL